MLTKSLMNMLAKSLVNIFAKSLVNMLTKSLWNLLTEPLVNMLPWLLVKMLTESLVNILAESLLSAVISEPASQRIDKNISQGKHEHLIKYDESSTNTLKYLLKWSFSVVDLKTSSWVYSFVVQVWLLWRCFYLSIWLKECKSIFLIEEQLWNSSNISEKKIWMNVVLYVF